MFARYRRGPASAAATAAAVAPPPGGGGGGPQHPHFQSSNHGRRGDENEAARDAASAAAALYELGKALDRLEFLTKKIADGNGDAEGGNVDDKNGDGVDGTIRSIINKGPPPAAGAPLTGRGKKIAPLPKNEEVAAAVAAADMADGDANAKRGEKNEDVKNEDEKNKDGSPADDGAPTTASDNGNVNNNGANSNNNDGRNFKTSKRIQRSPSAAAADIRRNSNADFLSVEPPDELEVIELIRRIAELVVLSERKAGQLLVKAAEAAEAADDDVGDEVGGRKSGNDGRQSEGRQSEGESTGESDASSAGAKKKKEAKDENEKKNKNINEYNEDKALPYLAIFDLFCERNALANIVNIVTGVAFLPKKSLAAGGSPSADAGISASNSSSNNNKNESPMLTRTHLLPPLPIATQAVQSISILIQNVSRATSLYFLLSNNRVNDLIKLPLHLYKRAELNALHTQYNKKYSKRKGKKMPPPPRDLSNYQSGEMGELTTHFVSFLKSLAMRVNAETLQFFLSFPLNEGGGGRSNGGGGVANGDGRSDGRIEKEEANGEVTTPAEGSSEATAEPMERPTEEPTERPTEEEGAAEEGTAGAGASGDPPSPARTAPQSAAARPGGARDDDADSTPMTYLERRNVVEFPLYARALEFCAPELDSFIRVTAMNVCMNIIRLATVGSDDDEDEDDKDDDEDCGSSRQSDNDGVKARTALPTSTPSGALHEAPPLPLQDRIAIARFACHPKRVSDLVSPLCARLTGQFGQVEGTVRALEELDDGPNDDGAGTAAAEKTPPGKKASSSSSKSSSSNEKKEGERKRLRDSIQNLIASMQDELLLLDDLLRVGLISLNEQAIEMMLATFVYPMLLQPLLLPLHRFGSSKARGEGAGEGEARGGTKRRNRRKQPVIVLQSPSPFSMRSTGKGVIDREESTTSYETANDTSTSATAETVDNAETEPQSATSAETVSDDDSAKIDAGDETARLHSSADMDLAPSKTALFGLSVIFHTLSNPTFRHLLLAALLHPSSPEASGGVVITAPPRITLPISAKKKRTVWSDDFQLEIRTEGNQRRRSEETESFQRDVNVYTFGTGPDGGRDGGNGIDGDGKDDLANSCVFILAPALVDVLRNNDASRARPADDGTSASTAGSTISARRANPYRRVLLSSISGAGEMVALQPLATAALHAAVSAAGGLVARKIMFPRTTTITESDVAAVKETLRCLCRGVVNASVTYDGWWKAKFDTVAARTLMDVACGDPFCSKVAGGALADVRLRSAEFLMTFPSSLDKKSKEREKRGDSGESPSKKDPERGQHLETWLLDRFFFDPADRHSTSVVEHVCYLKEEAKGEEGDARKEQYRYGLEVCSTIDVDGTSSLLCEGTVVIDNNVVVTGGTRGNTPFHCASSWALACLYLDAFCARLSKSTERLVTKYGAETPLPPARRLSYISPNDEDDCDSDDETAELLAHVSSKFAIAMLDEGDASFPSSSSAGSPGRRGDGGDAAPAHGSPVGLVGRAAFPCVCEVSPRHAPLFSGRTCISNEGIQWQSLYLVVVGRWAVLAEPGHGGSGGEGRVVAACRLSCLAVRKDPAGPANGKTPARRLLVAHASLDPRPPSLFTADGKGASGGPSLGPAGLRLTRSRMDLWFEDSDAAGHACRALSGKIAKARARRGGRIRAALLAR